MCTLICLPRALHLNAALPAQSDVATGNDDGVDIGIEANFAEKCILVTYSLDEYHLRLTR